MCAEFYTMFKDLYLHYIFASEVKLINACKWKFQQEAIKF